MLYLIIPPIVIVVCLAILLYLFSRKIPETAELQMKKRGEEGEETQIVKVGVISKFGQLLLRFLEKTTQKFKVFSLKFHNLSGKWLEFIKEKRKNDAAGRIEEAKGEEARVAEKEKEKEESEKFDLFVKKISTREIEKNGEVSVLETEEEKPEKPMISEEVTMPEFPSASRNKLEEVLIGRIIANPRDLGAYEKLGDLYFEQKNFSDAKDSYKQVLKANPVNRRVRIKMRKLERIIGR